MQESTLEAPTQEQSTPFAVEMRNITKTWPGVVANDHVNLKVRKGEIHALVGENGAGKTTLMNILYGLIHADSGEIYVNGQSVHITGPRDAIRLKIGMVHQHFMLIPP
jgi:general nucleoside transport system ATP-binding protein